MPITANVLATQTNRLKEIYVSISFTGTYTTGGDTLDLTALKNPSFFPEPFLARVPLSVGVMNEELSGFYVGIVPGAALNSHKLKVYQPGGLELANAASYSAQTGFASWVLHLVIIAPGGVN
jgi:hypothetical protein